LASQDAFGLSLLNLKESGGASSRSRLRCQYSIETCKLNDVEPYAYLDDVLSRMIHGYPINRLDELLPWAWKAGNPVKS
jgi:transposase